MCSSPGRTGRSIARGAIAWTAAVPTETAPSLAGTVAKFLWVPGGREYLVRVPGVATSPLSDADLAEVMNWMLWRFDREHLPSNFQPFTAAEMGPLRLHPLRLEAAGMRRIC